MFTDVCLSCIFALARERARVERASAFHLRRRRAQGAAPSEREPPAAPRSRYRMNSLMARPISTMSLSPVNSKFT